MNYTALAETARQQLKTFGRKVTLRTQSDGAYDPATGNTSTSTVTDIERWAAIFDFSEGQTQERGTLIQAGDKRALMEAGVVPSTSDQLIVGSDVYGIVNVGETNPAGTPVIYSLHLRK